MASKTPVDIAELEGALQQCCSDLAEAVARAQKHAQKEAEAQAEATGVPLTTPEGDPLPQWQPLTLSSIPGLDTLINTIEPPMQVIAVLLQVIAALLQVLATILLALPDIYKALILAAYELLKSIINDLLNTGAYLYIDAPGIQPSQTTPAEGGFYFDPGKTFRAGQTLQTPPPPLVDGFSLWSGRFVASFDDPGDQARPVLSDGAPVEAMFIIMAAPGLDELRYLIYLIGKLFNIGAFQNAYEKYLIPFPDPRRARARTKPVKPDWKSVRLRDLFPPLEGLMIIPEALLGLLGALDGLNGILRDIANAMLEKAKLLLAIADVILGIIQLLEALKASGMYFLTVSTTEGITGLKEQFMNAANRPPGGYVAGMCLLASGPGLGIASILWEMLGAAGSFVEGQAATFLSTAEAQLEQAQTSKAWDNAATTGASFAASPAGRGQEFDSDIEASAVQFTEDIKKEKGLAAALGRTPAEVAEMAARQRTALLDAIDNVGKIPANRNLRAGLAATRAARRRGARSLAMFAGRTPGAVQPCDDDPPKSKPPKRKATP